MWSYRLAQLFIYFFALFFLFFLHFMYKCLLALLFDIVLSITSFLFLTIRSHLHFLFVCRFLPAPLPRFLCLLVAAVPFFFALQTILNLFPIKFYLQCIDIAVFAAFFDSFRACFFRCANQLCTPICACSFSFFGGPLFDFFALLLLIYIHIIPRASCFPSISPYDPL